MTQVKPHLHYLTAKSASEIIHDFRIAFIIISVIEIILSLGFAGALIFARESLELKLAVPGFFLAVLVVGSFLLPHIFNTAKMLNEKGTMDIVPGLLATLQFILNILIVTGAIIPLFLWFKCDDLVRRHEAHVRRINP